MKIPFVAVALAIATFGISSAIAGEESLENKGQINATLDAKSKKLTLVIKGKEAGVYFNTEYPSKCSLTIASGGTLEKAELKKADATLEDAGKPGKAKSATFKVGADKSVTGECKVVLCTDNSCSSPFTMKFASN